MSTAAKNGVIRMCFIYTNYIGKVSTIITDPLVLKRLRSAARKIKKRREICGVETYGRKLAVELFLIKLD